MTIVKTEHPDLLFVADFWVYAITLLSSFPCHPLNFLSFHQSFRLVLCFLCYLSFGKIRLPISLTIDCKVQVALCHLFLSISFVIQHSAVLRSYVARVSLSSQEFRFRNFIKNAGSSVYSAIWFLWEKKRSDKSLVLSLNYALCDFCFFAVFCARS